ncbi:hypothetical protein HZB02_06410 [Candidatus Woesearchaeota archaeon]|nr:hypothetical protein [Candidatus Woesearchaeota archaeon]
MVTHRHIEKELNKYFKAKEKRKYAIHKVIKKSHREIEEDKILMRINSGEDPRVHVFSVVTPFQRSLRKAKKWVWKRIRNW